MQKAGNVDFPNDSAEFSDLTLASFVLCYRKDEVDHSIKVEVLRWQVLCIEEHQEESRLGHQERREEEEDTDQACRLRHLSAPPKDAAKVKGRRSEQDQEQRTEEGRSRAQAQITPLLSCEHEFYFSAF